MLGANVFVREAFGFLGGKCQHALALVAEWKINAGGNFFPYRGVAFDLFSDRLHRRMLAEEAIGERLVLAQESEQQVLRLDVRGPELTRLIAREEDHASRFFGIPFEHLILRDSSSRQLSVYSDSLHDPGTLFPHPRCRS